MGMASPPSPAQGTKRKMPIIEWIILAVVVLQFAMTGAFYLFVTAILRALLISR